jgi:NitT/TauT family transport system permease protein
VSAATLRGLAGGLLLLALWEAVVRLAQVPPWILPPPSGILATTWLVRGALLDAAAMTLFEAVTGYAIGAVLGLVLAMLLALTTPLRKLVLPMVVVVNSVPVAAYAPLALLWFGTGALSKGSSRTHTESSIPSFAPIGCSGKRLTGSAWPATGPMRWR